MKTWSYSINSRPELMRGSIELEERPWWLALAEWFAFWVDWRWLSKVKLPDWPQVAWKDADAPCSPREWWGDLGQMVFSYVTQPLFQWAYMHPRNRRTEVDLGYQRVREIFYTQDREFFDEHEAALDDLMIKETTNCPQCGYPDHAEGGPYKGIYMPGERCTFCGYLDGEVTANASA